MNMPTPVCSEPGHLCFRRVLSALGLLLLFAVTQAFAALPRAMWVWDATPIVNYNAQQALLNFSQSKGITTLFIHTGSVFLEPAAKPGQIQVTEPQLGDFIAEAHYRGIAVHALDGDPELVFAGNHNLAVARLQRAILFNYNNLAINRLDGFQWDIEPHAMPQWLQNPGQQISYLTGLLNVAKKLTTAAQNGVPKMKIGFVVPFWYDEPAYTLSFNGKSKLAVRHLFDLLKPAAGSHVAIMAYRDTAAASFPLAQGELQYAKNNTPAVKIWYGQETGAFDPPHITFHEEKQPGLTAAINQLQNNYLLPYTPPQADVVAGIAIHAYEFYKLW